MHVHFFPENIASKVTAQLADHYGIPVPYRGTLHEYQKIRRRDMVDAAVYFTVATVPSQVKTANRWAIENNKDGLIGFGTLHPDFDDIDAEINRLKAAGIKGIKFHPDFQKFYIDDIKALSIYEKLASDFIIIFHVGDKSKEGKINYATPERLSLVLDVIPNLKVIAAHMGGYQMWDRALNCLVGKNLYFDTSSSSEFLPTDKFALMIKEHGYDRILLGSDYPISDPGRECYNVAKLKLKEHHYNAIIGENAKNLLRGLDARQKNFALR